MSFSKIDLKLKNRLYEQPFFTNFPNLMVAQIRQNIYSLISNIYIGVEIKSKAHLTLAAYTLTPATDCILFI